jgi:hypothetical protein
LTAAVVRLTERVNAIEARLNRVVFPAPAPVPLQPIPCPNTNPWTNPWTGKPWTSVPSSELTANPRN